MEVDLLERAKEKLTKEPANKQLRTWIRKLRKRVKGVRYRGDSIEGIAINDIWTAKERRGQKEGNYKVISSKFDYEYFGHYDPKKYREQMEKYKQGLRKSRPNGRKWCKIPYSYSRKKFAIS